MRAIIPIWLGSLFLINAADGQAQSNPTFIQLGRAKGALYKPDAGTEPRASIGACANRAKSATEYSNARKIFFDYDAKRINDRF